MNTPSTSNQSQRDIYSVSRLNSEVRAVLEGSFPLLWVEGEISNLARPASGHIYFSLKDAHAQVRCAMFRMKRQLLRFQPENGQTVQVRARVGLYEGRGEFQLIIEHMEPSGEGALRQAFEALKQKLAAEGLFDIQRKQALPKLATRLGLITSPSGAAIRDILTVAARRYPALPILIYPTSVQGTQAASEIVDAITLANRRQECDLLILARGGGSLEDLDAFNQEQVARAIAESSIPIISAVGHEIDFTIADFVADQRAPTPSAAAELATPDQHKLIEQLQQLQQRQVRQLQQLVSYQRQQAQALSHRLQRVHPEQRLRQQQQTIDRLELGLQNRIRQTINSRQQQLQSLQNRLQSNTPAIRLQNRRQRFSELSSRLKRSFGHLLQDKQQSLAACAGKLHTLSPLATLDRGYSITCRTSDGSVIQSADSVAEGERIETRLKQGLLISRVEKRD